MNDEKYGRFLFVPVILIAIFLYCIGYNLVVGHQESEREYLFAGRQEAVNLADEAGGEAENEPIEEKADAETAKAETDTEEEEAVQDTAEEKTAVNADDDSININTAEKDELMSLDGIGEKRAEDIIKTREAMGGFESIEDIMAVDGIGSKTFEKIKDKIKVK